MRQKIDLFAEKDTDLGKTKTLEMRIETGNHPPIKLKPYRTSFAKRQIISKAIDEMLKAKIIQPSSHHGASQLLWLQKKMVAIGFVLILENWIK